MDSKDYDEVYMDNLKREAYFDVVTGVLKWDDVSPILVGAEDYLRLRRKGVEILNKWSRRLRGMRGLKKSLMGRGMLMINDKQISSEKISQEFAALDYICDEEIAEAVYFSILLKKPLLIEGEPGVGKTEIAKVLAAMLGSELIRLQCYEGLDENKALYEWNYQKQLLFIQGQGRAVEDVFGEEFLMVRPLMKAILAEGMPPVLLIDEIDKADEEFEAFLLEVLSDFQISIPEFGTIKARTIPLIVITNNDVRELTNALKRRCIYLYIDYPSIEKERDILLKKVPEIKPTVALQIAQAMNNLRSKPDLLKKPSIAEGIDFARAATLEGIDEITDDVVKRFLPTLLKNRDDIAMMRKGGQITWLGGI
ncbi:MAG: MoxR family ATPase [Syntrophomonadaceae bacterium]